ncbi:hypothetical protein CH341_27545 [Rhodoplanes roseus]|uniref:Uncharacterized protein n=1 Tax=Rhodoplanes roseus TaxID=29409 RepID=A0A327KKI2_9BRAD|nr:hypothetical protein CH341_27545 [Rhodoplanes roseus]
MVGGAAVAILLLIGAAGPAAAQQGCCVGGPVVVYGASPVPPAVPPTGYLLDPSDARPPIYVVNQGPLYRGAGIYAVPTFSEGGYAYSIRYPYTYGPAYGRSHYVPYKRPHAYPPRRYGYIGPTERVAGAPPYGAYEVRPAPGAKIVHVQQVARTEAPAAADVTGSVPAKPAAPR